MVMVIYYVYIYIIYILYYMDNTWEADGQDD